MVHDSSCGSTYSPPSTAPTTPLSDCPGHGVCKDPVRPDEPDDCFSDTSVLDAVFWTETVPRLIRDDLAVRYANMAVHMLILHKQPELIVQGSMDSFAQLNYFSQALSYYGNALRQVQQSPNSRGLQATILCSMFFAVFEAINEDSEATEAHIFNGQRMMNELFALQPQHQHCSSPGSLRAELEHLLHYISMQVRMGVVDYSMEMDSLAKILKQLRWDDGDVEGVVCEPVLPTADLDYADF